MSPADIITASATQAVVARRPDIGAAAVELVRELVRYAESSRHPAVITATAFLNVVKQEEAKVPSTGTSVPSPREALAWYGEQASAAARYIDNPNTATALLAVLTALANDAGQRAAAAMPGTPDVDDMKVLLATQLDNALTILDTLADKYPADLSPHAMLRSSIHHALHAIGKRR